MLTREQEMMAQQLMQMNPGMSPQEAIQNVLNMSPGEMVQEGTQGVPQGTPMGAVPGDIPQVTPGLLGPGGNFQPQPQQPQAPQQGHPMCGPGTTFNGTQCVLGVNF